MMKSRIVVLLMLVVALGVGHAGACDTWTAQLKDSYGDGWNGATMFLFDCDRHDQLYAATASGSGSTFSFCLPQGFHIRVGTGSYPSEISWTLSRQFDGQQVTGGATYEEDFACANSTSPSPSPTISFSPTPSPTISFSSSNSPSQLPTPQCNTWTAQLMDSYGDGWNGATMHVFDCDQTHVFYAVTASGHGSSFEFCLPQDFHVSVSAGSWPSEISWALSRQFDGQQVVGNAPASTGVGCGGASFSPGPYPSSSPYPLLSPSPSPTPACYDWSAQLMDSYGDGWEGATMYIFDCERNHEYYAVTAYGYGSSFDFCLPPAFRVSVGSGSFPSEISWTLMRLSDGHEVAGRAPTEKDFGCDASNDSSGANAGAIAAGVIVPSLVLGAVVFFVASRRRVARHAEPPVGGLVTSPSPVTPAVVPVSQPAPVLRMNWDSPAPTFPSAVAMEMPAHAVASGLGCAVSAEVAQDEPGLMIPLELAADDDESDGCHGVADDHDEGLEGFGAVDDHGDGLEGLGVVDDGAFEGLGWGFAELDTR